MPQGPNALKITDLTFRDGHQSLFATRVRTEDLAAIAPQMDSVGFWSMEVWGGATFDVMTRFLNEDPWERIRVLKRLMPHVPLQMLLRGQNLVGYRNYADDVVQAFVQHAAECGIDVFRVFDALNDERNLATAVAAVRAAGKHVQAAISYSLTGNHLGGPVFTLDYYLTKARAFEQMGADSLCIKDMAGLLNPEDATLLVTALKREIRIPLAIHTHFTSGMAYLSLQRAIDAGADIVDTCLAPFALRTSHAAVEPLVAALTGTPRETGLDLGQLLGLGEYFESIAPKYREFLDDTKLSIIDTGVLKHQIPGGMFSNMVAQLRQAGALDRLAEVYEELPRTRKELGSPPLVTPTSQIVGTQAVLNVLFGRYKMISKEIRDYAFGLYGTPPSAMDPEVQQLALKGYERGEVPITGRAADLLEPEMAQAEAATMGLAKDIGDVLVYALYPTTGLRFLKWKYGLEAPPAETRARTIDEVKREAQLAEKARKGELVERGSAAAAPTTPPRSFSVRVDGELFTVEVTPDAPSAATPASAGVPAAPAAAAAVSPDRVITAPMPGVVLKHLVNVGDVVEDGQPVLVIEAMKMQNTLASPRRGKIASFPLKPGDNMNRGDVLATIEPM